MNPLEEYLVRASLEFLIDFDHANRGQNPAIPHRLPVNMGPFQLDRSPNAEHFLADVGFIDPEQLGRDHPDWEYPVSLLYVESEISVPDKCDPQTEAESKFESLEWLLRLFQPGDVSVRRHNWMWHYGAQGPKLTLFFNFRPVKPQSTALYERCPYLLRDEDLNCLAAFFESHWDAFSKASDNFKTALRRFNSSYEKRDLADRLLDLVIALDALFGDGEPGSITYKVAMRGASWLYPLGDGRADAFRKIKRLYGLRSRAVHGGAPKPLQGDQVGRTRGVRSEESAQVPGQTDR